MVINCDRCAVRGAACANCAVTFVAHPGERIELDAADVRALTALANAGMIPPLRYAPRQDAPRQDAPRQRDSAARRPHAPRTRYAPPVAKAS
jgi:hypothetical protein